MVIDILEWDSSKTEREMTTLKKIDMPYLGHDYKNHFWRIAQQWADRYNRGGRFTERAKREICR